MSSFKSRTWRLLLALAAGLAALAMIEPFDDPAPEGRAPAAPQYDYSHMPAPSFSLGDIFRMPPSRF